MNVVLLLMRTRLRSSWRAAIVLVVLLGLGGSVALAVAAGARRTASANDAILRAANASDLNFAYGPADPREMEATTRPIAGVADVNQWVGLSARITGHESDGAATIIGHWQDPVTISRPVVTAGRFPTGAAEVMVNEAAARRYGVGLGSQLEASLESFDGTPPDPPTRLIVVGIGLQTDEVIQDEQLRAGHLLLAPRAYIEEHLDRAVWGKTRVVVARGADPGTIVASLAEKGLFVDELLGQDRARVQDALRPLVVTLAGLAALAATATVLISSQALTRLLRRRRGDDASLAAMGCTTTQLVATDVLYATLVATAGAALAAGSAVAVSPVFPVGPVRRAGVDRGVDLDLAVLAGGGTALAVVVIALVAFSSWRRRIPTRPIGPGRAPGGLFSRPAIATGLRLGTAQRGLVTTVASIAAGLAVLVASVTFTGSLGQLIDRPDLVGFSWDLSGSNAFDSIDLAEVRRLTDDATLERLTGLDYAFGEANGQPVNLAILEAVKGSPWPPLAAGRLPAARDELLMGRATLRQLGLRIGDTVSISLPVYLNPDNPDEATTVSRALRIVGSAVAPAIGIGGTDTPKLDTGVLLTAEAVDLPASALASEIVLFDLAEGAKPAALRARFPQGLPTSGNSATSWFTSAAPAEVSQAEGARTVIWLALAALATAIVGAIVHTLLGSVRQRRKEYAVLKALGFTRGQVRATVLTQSGALLAVALVLALPVGIAAGRWLWTGFADRIGVVADPTVPVLLLAGSVLATIALVQGAALVPAAVARRTSLTRSLQSE